MYINRCAVLCVFLHLWLGEQGVVGGMGTEFLGLV